MEFSEQKFFPSDKNSNFKNQHFGYTSVRPFLYFDLLSNLMGPEVPVGVQFWSK